MTDQQLQSLRNMGNECEEAADEIERLRALLHTARGALADIASGNDMTLPLARDKAARIYAATDDEMAQEQTP